MEAALASSGLSLWDSHAFSLIHFHSALADQECVLLGRSGSLLGLQPRFGPQLKCRRLSSSSEGLENGEGIVVSLDCYHRSHE